MRNYKFKIEGNIGGFLWWGIVKFGKTELEEETKDENASRNIFVFYLLVFLISFITVKYF
jgi:hypothetical protein